MVKSLSRLGVGVVIAVAMFTGLAAFGPANAGVLGSQKAEAAGCSINYYRITAQSVTVRQGPGWSYPSSGTYYYNNTVAGPHGGVSGGWTQVFTPGSGIKGGVGYIPDQYRDYLGCN